MGDYGSDKSITDQGAQTDALGELIRAAGKRPLPRVEDIERVRSASRAAWQGTVRARRRRRRTVVLAAAASVAVVVIGIATVFDLSPPSRVATVAVVQGRAEVLPPGAEQWMPLSKNSAPILAGTRLRTVADGRAAFELAGISLRIDSGSRLTFASPGHIGLEGGTVYVDSGGAQDRKAPLAIETAFGLVRDVGTQFEVRALTTGLRLRVRSGRVNLYRSVERSTLKAVAGQQVLVEATGRIERREIAPDGPEWQWAEALATPLQVDGRSAFDVLSWAARESGRRLVFSDSDAELRARNAILSGGQKMKLTPAQAMRIAVATSGDLQASFGDGTLVVRSR